MCCKKNSLSLTLIIAAAIIILAVAYCLALKTFWFVGNGKATIRPNTSETENNSKTLPIGYTLDNYKIAEVSDIACQNDPECVTPGKYLMMSSCPYTSLCLKNKCTVVCPDYAPAATVPSDWKTYRNTEYGFSLVFSESWQGYQVVKSTWQGWAIASGGAATQGPELTIKNTQGKKELQPIPIMIFTPEQWAMVENESIAVSAAPIGPGKIGQNAKYIFALPPRWVGFMDYAMQDEAVNITKTFKTF